MCDVKGVMISKVQHSTSPTLPPSLSLPFPSLLGPSQDMQPSPFSHWMQI